MGTQQTAKTQIKVPVSEAVKFHLKELAREKGLSTGVLCRALLSEFVEQRRGRVQW